MPPLSIQTLASHLITYTDPLIQQLPDDDMRLTVFGYLFLEGKTNPKLVNPPTFEISVRLNKSYEIALKILKQCQPYEYDYMVSNDQYGYGLQVQNIDDDVQFTISSRYALLNNNSTYPITLKEKTKEELISHNNLGTSCLMKATPIEVTVDEKELSHLSHKARVTLYIALIKINQFLRTSIASVA